MATREVTSAHGRPPVELLPMTHGMWRALQGRSERLGRDWPDTAAEDLSQGRLEGYVVTDGAEIAALALISLRERRGYGHIHQGVALSGIEGAEPLMRALISRVPPEVDRLDVGTTGLSLPAEASLARALRSVPGGEVVERLGLERPIPLDDLPDEPPPLPGYSFVAIPDVPIPEMAALDRRAFAQGVDAFLLPDDVEGDRKMLEGIRSGSMGRYLDLASTAIRSDDGRLVGFLLAVEETARRAVLVSLAVDPDDRRHGIAAAMLQRTLRALAALGYASARLWVTAANRPARALYERMGFGSPESTFIYRWIRPRSR
jgi:ribosomal protein S18 acetylase RimI-like enzyme